MKQHDKPIQVKLFRKPFLLLLTKQDNLILEGTQFYNNHLGKRGGFHEEGNVPQRSTYYLRSMAYLPYETKIYVRHTHILSTSWYHKRTVPNSNSCYFLLEYYTSTIEQMAPNQAEVTMVESWLVIPKDRNQKVVSYVLG